MKKMNVGVALQGDPQTGITLIALIITIIVMLILVGVTINVALNGGLFEKAKNAKEQTQKEVEKEELISVTLGAYNSKNDSVLLSDLTSAIDTAKFSPDTTGKSVEGSTYVVKGESGTYWEIDLKTAEVREWKEQVVENIWVNEREFSSTAVNYGATYTGEVTVMRGVTFTSLRFTTDGSLNGTVKSMDPDEPHATFSHSSEEVRTYLNTAVHIRNGNILFIATTGNNYNAFVFENDAELGYIVKIYNGNYSSDYVNDIVTSENYKGYLSAPAQ